MTFLGISRAKDTSEEIDSSDSLTTSIWREVEFESDVDHREMTRTYGSDDYLSRWLPNIKQGDESGLLRKEIVEKRPEKEHQNTLFKSPCHHHEGRKSTLKDNKIQTDPTKKTYFEAIKCSPMKLRQSIATFKRPKLDENFNVLKPNQSTALNPKPPNTTGASEQASLESMESLTEISSTIEKTLMAENVLVKSVQTKTAKSKTSLGIVEMHNDETGQLGSLCLRRSLPENLYSENMYTPCTMVGGRLRKLHRGADNMLLTGRNKNKELLVRCESIMIYPKVLINQKQQLDKYKFTTNSKQQSEKYKVVTGLTNSHHQQSDKFATKPDKPKEAWQDNNQPPLPPNSKTPENYTRLPQLTTKDHTTPQVHNQKISPEIQMDNAKGRPDVETRIIQNSKGQPLIELRAIQNSASTKIIIPFGENELNQFAEKKAKVSPTPQKVQGLGPSLKSDVGDVVSLKMAGGSDGHSARERGAPMVMKPRYLKESSILNEKLHLTRRNSDIILDVRQPETARKFPVATQYLTVTTPNSPLKRFRIPTGVENSELFVGRENYPPKTKSTGPYRFSYSQRGLSEDAKGFDGESQDNGGQRRNVALKIGGKGLLKARLARKEQESGKLVEDECKKRVQFLVHNSHYFA